MDVNAQFSYWERPKLRVLSDRQRETIYRSALEVLERTGAKLYSPQAVALMKEAGAVVIDEHLVKIPSGVVENAVATAGKREVLADRTGKRTIILEGDNVYFGPGSDNPMTIDLETGAHRTSVLNDVAQAARVADALPNIDFLMSFALASDVRYKAEDCHHFEAMINNSTKPITVTALDLDALKTIHEMCCVVCGGEENFRQNPFIILYEQPHSPLKHAEHSLDKLIFCTQKGIPVLYASTPSIGAASPVTLGGSFVLNMAEYLTALVLVQQVKKGATLVFGGGPTTLDMRTTVYSYSAPETMLSLSVRKELGEYLGIPVFNAGGFSDAKIPDQQAALECATSLIYAALAGGNLIHDVGYLASGHDLLDRDAHHCRRADLADQALPEELHAGQGIPGHRSHRRDRTRRGFPGDGPYPQQVQGGDLVSHDHRPLHPRELGRRRAAPRCATGRARKRGIS